MLGSMPGSVRVARILGIDIRIHFSWIVIFFLVVITLADNIFPANFPAWSRPKTFVVSAVAAFLFFCSILAHELAHAVVARRFRMSVSSITLFLLGGVANLTKEPPSARAEFFMAAAGPATSVVIGAVALGVEALTDASLDRYPSLQTVGAVAGYLGFINTFVLAPFNLVPGFPLDGGRILRSIIWAVRGDRLVATRIAARGGQAVAGLLFLGAVWRLFSGDTGGLWWALIAYFLYNAATSTLNQERISGLVGTVRVGQLMTTEFRTTTPARPWRRSSASSCSR
jgi:Zn-dependent protease